LQPALSNGTQDEATLRRLTCLNSVLTKVIDRFEEAYPESRNILPKPKSADEQDSSDDEDEKDEDDIAGSAPGLIRLRRSHSMTELARGLELEEGDVHRFGSFIKRRNLIGVDTDLSGEQLLEAILRVHKETVEREVWDKDGLSRVLRRTIDDESSKPSSSSVDQTQSDTVVPLSESTPIVESSVSRKRKKDSDSHSI
jgi:hypothetical protein